MDGINDTNLKKLSNSDKAVVIEDNALENAIRTVIDKPKGYIYINDLSNILELDASQKGIKSLNGLGNLINLEKLNLTDNEVLDIEPLRNLTELKELYLTNCNIKELTSIKNLTNLERLYIGNFRRGRTYFNKYTDLKALEKLIKLKELNIQCMSINLEGIEYLSELESLSLYYNLNLKNIEKLSNLVNIKKLDISYTDVSDINSLKLLTELTEVNISNSEITDISVLSKFTKLNKLIAWNIINDQDYEILKESLPKCGVFYKPR